MCSRQSVRRQRLRKRRLRHRISVRRENGPRVREDTATIRREIVEYDVPMAEDTLKRVLSVLAFAEAAAHMTETHPDGCEIADRWIEYTLDAQGTMHARAVYETHTDVAVTRDALYQQGG